MKETKFTKGGWVAIEGESCDMEVVITSINRLDNRIVHICEMDVDYDGVIGDEQKANAHLIAAAPEMYQAIVELIKLRECQAEMEFGKEVSTPSMDKYRKLLAKARGEL